MEYLLSFLESVLNVQTMDPKKKKKSTDFLFFFKVNFSFRVSSVCSEVFTGILFFGLSENISILPFSWI